MAYEVNTGTHQLNEGYMRIIFYDFYVTYINSISILYYICFCEFGDRSFFASVEIMAKLNGVLH